MLTLVTPILAQDAVTSATPMVEEEIFCNDTTEIEGCNGERVRVVGIFATEPREFEIIEPVLDMGSGMSSWRHYDFDSDFGNIVLLSKEEKLACDSEIVATGEFTIIKRICEEGVKCIPESRRLVVDNWWCLD